MGTQNRKINKKLIASSIIALIFMALSYFIHWLFIVPAVILYFIGYKFMR